MTYRNPSQAIDAIRLAAAKELAGERYTGACWALMELHGELKSAGLLRTDPDGWSPISDAKLDGTTYLCFGQHVMDDPPLAQRGVKSGDLWICLLQFDIWRDAPKGNQWVFSLNGMPAWSPPLLFKPLRWPGLDEVAGITGGKP